MGQRDTIQKLTAAKARLEIVVYMVSISLLYSLFAALYLPLVRGQFFLNWAIWLVVCGGINWGLVRLSKAGRTRLGRPATMGKAIWDAFTLVGGGFTSALFLLVLQSSLHRNADSEELAQFALLALVSLGFLGSGIITYLRYTHALMATQDRSTHPDSLGLVRGVALG